MKGTLLRCRVPFTTFEGRRAGPPFRPYNIYIYLYYRAQEENA